ncbi:TolC family protein, partial [bacterium]|nr:TolC family protein [bacterium]
MILILIIGFFMQAQEKSVLTLQSYLEQVQKQSADGRALVAKAQAAEVKVKQAELMFSPELFAEYSSFDDRKPPLNPGFSPTSTVGHQWKVGVEKQTNFGLGGKLYFENNNVVLNGVNPSFFPISDYNSGRAVLEMKQSLWRNGFGEQTSAEYNATLAKARAEYEAQKFELKKFLLEAENTYWAMVTYNQIVSLQEENVERAKKLSEWMGKQGRLKLSDDVDVLQSKTAYEMRQLELESSRQEKNAMARLFNTMRGMDIQDVELLEKLRPLKQELLSSQKIKAYREDFAAAKNSSVATEMMAKSRRSSLKPELNLVGSVASNGLDPRFAGVYGQIRNVDHPSWSVGVQLKVPLYFSLSEKLKSAALAEMRAAQDSAANADFQLMRAWQDTLQKNKDFYDIYVRAKDIEASYGLIVQK